MEAKYCTSDTDQHKHIENMKISKIQDMRATKKIPLQDKKNFILTPPRWQAKTLKQFSELKPITPSDM